MATNTQGHGRAKRGVLRAIVSAATWQVLFFHTLLHRMVRAHAHANEGQRMSSVSLEWSFSLVFPLVNSTESHSWNVLGLHPLSSLEFVDTYAFSLLNFTKFPPPTLGGSALYHTSCGEKMFIRCVHRGDARTRTRNRRNMESNEFFQDDFYKQSFHPAHPAWPSSQKLPTTGFVRSNFCKFLYT